MRPWSGWEVAAFHIRVSVPGTLHVCHKTSKVHGAALRYDYQMLAAYLVDLMNSTWVSVSQPMQHWRGCWGNAAHLVTLQKRRKDKSEYRPTQVSNCVTPPGHETSAAHCGMSCIQLPTRIGHVYDTAHHTKPQ